jgi:rare lipoprotein A (peptidoglycan hydrolase)
MPRHTRIARTALLLLLAGLLLLPAGAAQGHRIKRRWAYEPRLYSHDWTAHSFLKRRHRRWHENNQLHTEEEHGRFHHRELVHAHRRQHKYRVRARQSGGASWYTGSRGACGKPLRGLYAAHKSWPCGTKVAVKRGRRTVVVRVLDRGPYTEGRVIDLSKGAFSRLGSPSRGVMGVKIYRLQKRR